MSAAPPADPATALEQLAGAPVLVVGDVMLDRFLYGAVERISPEGPIPILKVERELAMLGGAGNVVRNLAALGARPSFVAVVGDDHAGLEVQRLVAEATGGEGHLLLDRGRRSTIKERYIAGGQQLLRVDRETAPQLSEGLAHAAVSAVVSLLGEARALVLSDYGKGLLGGGTLQRLIAHARERGVAVLVDPKGRDFARYRGATVITPNRRELAEASGLATDGDAGVVAAAERVMAEAGIEAVLATRSEQGMTLVEPDGAGARRVTHLPALAREVFDVSGAGDTVVATMAAAIAAGLPRVTAAELANAAAGIVVGKVGTAVASPNEILHALHARELLSGETKVFSLEALLSEVGRWRRLGQRVGFTNGCFDLLHPGHISLLTQARKLCDRLVVGLNSDASVRRLKGEGRPVQSEGARATVLASLASVDAVVLFADETPLQLIRQIRPDVLVKGADYTVEQVVGAELVRSWGGRVALAELMPGQSTSGTIRRLKG
jgi:D-beta-D-heptose 7-phosphate kinase/D-beta-D-heptose 1-phosphate adenosyltransferase